MTEHDFNFHGWRKELPLGYSQVQEPTLPLYRGKRSNVTKPRSKVRVWAWEVLGTYEPTISRNLGDCSSLGKKKKKQGSNVQAFIQSLVKLSQT
jgi:hypothetical protein